MSGQLLSFRLRHQLKLVSSHSLQSLLAVAVDGHLLEAVSLPVAGKLLPSSHSSVESLQFRKLVETARSEDEMVIKQVEHAVVHERYLKVQCAACGKHGK